MKPRLGVISRLTVTGFQSIAEADIDLGAWTTLVGSSDVGKSALVRALHALLTNRRGDDFIRHGEKECSVCVTLGDGRSILWTKARGKSGAYQIDGRVYEKTAGEVPAEVLAALPVRVEVAGDTLMPGFQRQHDAPFLLADTSRRRAQILGEFDGSTLLLTADGRVRRHLTQQQRLVKERADELVRLHADLEGLAWVDAAADALERARDRQAVVDARTALIASLTELADQVEDVEGRLAAAKHASEALTFPLARLDDAIAALEATELRLAVLTDLAGRVEATARVQAAIEAAPMPDLDAMGARIDELERRQHLADDVEGTEGALVVAGEQLAWLGAEEAVLNEAAAALVGTICETCGQVITKEAVGA